MACVVMAVIITMSLILGAELGSKANPTTTTYVPRPEWYFFFLFEVLRVIKPPALVQLATIGVPTICMILLFLLPFYDRGPERRPERRPIATITGITVICDGLPDLLGANAGSPTAIEMATPAGVAHSRRQDPLRIRSRQEGRRPVGLSGLPQDRRERERRTRAEPDEHRPTSAPPGDRPDAREPDGADASFKNLPPKKFTRSSNSSPSSSSRRRWPPAREPAHPSEGPRLRAQGKARGAAGAGDVRPDRRRL